MDKKEINKAIKKVVALTKRKAFKRDHSGEAIELMCKLGLAEPPPSEPYSRVCDNCNLEKPTDQFPKSDPFGRYETAKKRYCQACIEGFAQYKREYVRELLGGSCYCCGDKRLEFISIEPKLPPKTRMPPPSSLWGLLYRGKAKAKSFRLVCYNCQSSWRYKGYCPCKNEHKITSIKPPEPRGKHPPKLPKQEVENS